MGDITGPIRTLAGARHPLPNDATCDVHPDRPAIANVQGETDSFGCETHYCCQECLDEIREYARSVEARTGKCEWCKHEATDLLDRRDHDEGLYGRVYRVCGVCRKRIDDEARQELEKHGYDD
jgi:hypothetical protein